MHIGELDPLAVVVGRFRDAVGGIGRILLPTGE